jgi:hypothetical protein
MLPGAIFGDKKKTRRVAKRLGMNKASESSWHEQDKMERIRTVVDNVRAKHYRNHMQAPVLERESLFEGASYADANSGHWCFPG